MTRTPLLSNAVHVESSAAERASASRVADALTAPNEHAMSLLLGDGTAVPLSPGLISVLRTSIGELAEGHAVTVLPFETELTPAQNSRDA